MSDILLDTDLCHSIVAKKLTAVGGISQLAIWRLAISPVMMPVKKNTSLISFVLALFKRQFPAEKNGSSLQEFSGRAKECGIIGSMIDLTKMDPLKLVQSLAKGQVFVIPFQEHGDVQFGVIMAVALKPVEKDLQTSIVQPRSSKEVKKLSIDESFLQSSSPSTPVTERPQVKKLNVDTGFLASASTPPPTSDHRPESVGKLSIPGFLEKAQSEESESPPKKAVQVGKLAIPGFLEKTEEDNSTSSGTPQVNIGKLSVDTSFLSSGQEKEDVPLRRTQTTVGKLTINKSFLEAEQPIQEESNKDPLERSPSKISIGNAFQQSGEQADVKVCPACGKQVYSMEKIAVDGEWYHQQCFKCSQCGQTLTAGRYAKAHGVVYCKPHFAQLFKSKGNYDEGFGHEQRKQDFENEESNLPQLQEYTSEQVSSAGCDIFFVVVVPETSKVLVLSYEDIMCRELMQMSPDNAFVCEGLV
eukprot:m.107378 g.107378  ORF g.107378 m.107378 type:complete len:471 (+) comp13926_c0_seq3:270-1682(+)